MDTLWLKDAGCLCRLGCREGGSKLISPVELEFRLQAFSLRGNELADFRSQALGVTKKGANIDPFFCDYDACVCGVTKKGANILRSEVSPLRVP